MSWRVIVSPEANENLQELDEWWRHNRPAAATRVVDEFKRILGVLTQTPRIGSPVGTIERRLALRGTPHCAYYELDESRREVHINSVWSSMREEGPPLKSH